MARGRRPGDGSRHSSRRNRRDVANAGGLEALGSQMGGGASRETVASAIGELVRRGVAERRNKTLYINDYAALKDMIGSVQQPEHGAPRFDQGRAEAV